MIANAIAVRSTVCYDRIFKQQPPEAPFNAQRIVTKKLLGRRALVLILILIVGPPVEETCHIGQGRTENLLNLKAFHLLQLGSRAIGVAVFHLT